MWFCLLELARMRRTTSRSNSVQWHQRPVAELLAQSPQFVFAVLQGAWHAWLGGLKRPIPLIVTLLVPLLVFTAQRLATSRRAAQQPPHLQGIINELLAIRVPTGTIVPNHANTRLLYCKYTTNDTWAVDMLDLE